MIVLTPPRPVEPRQLRALAAKLATVEPRAQKTASTDQRAAAMRLVAEQSQRAAPVGAPRKLIPALIEILADTKDNTVKVTIVSMLLAAEAIGWRRLWLAWQLAGVEGRRLITRLAVQIVGRARARAAFRQRLPAWLPLESVSACEAALRDPSPHVLRAYEAQKRKVTDWPAGTELTESSPVGKQALYALASSCSDEVWRRATPDAIRAWAEPKRRLRLVQIVADRQLLAAFPKARGPGDVYRREPLLQAWVLRMLQDPSKRPDFWDGVSARARQLFEWMLLADECQKIFAEFRKHAERDERAAYWEKYLSRVLDARFYATRDSAVCMLRIGQLLVIEFGQTNNACFFYRWPQGAPALRTLELPRYLGPGSFKDTYAVRLDTTSFPFVKKLSHTHGWQTKFHEFLTMES